MLTALFTLTLIIITAITFFLYTFRYATSNPNQWMLVIRNGRVVKSGIGISSFTQYGDKIVKFPSRINKVKFSAQQVTQEMQGIEVSGVIIWAIFREADGPSRAYKMLGEDLKQPVPKTANDSLVDMANSIVRDRIANATIDTILRKRSDLRDAIRKEMNEVVNGWGVWLESVEITDVKIMSNALFKNLQTEFREEQRQKAELIQMRISRELEEKRLAQEVEMSKQRADNKTKVDIYQLNQNLKVKEEDQKFFNKDQEIQKQRLDAAQLLKVHRFEHNHKYDEEVKNRNQQIKLEDLNRRIEKEKKLQKLNQVQEETRTLNIVASNEIYRMKEELEIELEKKELEMKCAVYNDTPFEYAVLDRVKEIYGSLPISQVKVCTYGDGQSDPVGGIVGQIINSVSGLKQEETA